MTPVTGSEQEAATIWEALSEHQRNYLTSISIKDGRQTAAKLATMIQMLYDMQLIETYYNNNYSIDIVITDLGRAVLAQGEPPSSAPAPFALVAESAGDDREFSYKDALDECQLEYMGLQDTLEAVAFSGDRLQIELATLLARKK